MPEDRKDGLIEDEDRVDFVENPEQPAVEGEEPDLVGRWVLRIKKAICFLLWPFWKVLSVFLAPLWKPFRKGAKGITKRDWLLFLGMIAAVAMILVAPVVYLKLQNTHKEENSIYSVVVGKKIYWGNGRFEIDDQNRVQFYDSQGEQRDVSGQPFYYEGENAMFWPFYGLWYSVEDQDCGKIERFSRIQYEHGKGCFVQGKNGEEISLPGFLYDNQNTYVVLENVKLICNGKERNLVPLSYVRLYTNNSMDVYSYGEENGEVIAVEGSPEIVFSNGSRIDLKGDLMYYPNGTYRLLFGVLDFYDPVGDDGGNADETAKRR